jgi:hypothetical protein
MEALYGFPHIPISDVEVITPYILEVYKNVVVPEVIVIRVISELGLAVDEGMDGEPQLAEYIREVVVFLFVWKRFPFWLAYVVSLADLEETEFPFAITPVRIEDPCSKTVGDGVNNCILFIEVTQRVEAYELFLIPVRDIDVSNFRLNGVSDLLDLRAGKAEYPDEVRRECGMDIKEGAVFIKIFSVQSYIGYLSQPNSSVEFYIIVKVKG